MDHQWVCNTYLLILKQVLFRFFLVHLVGMSLRKWLSMFTIGVRHSLLAEKVLMISRIIIKPLSVLLLLLVAVSSVNLSAKEVSVKHRPEITVQSSSFNHRVCMYEGKDYSLGAVLVVDKIVLECKPENDFESNGRLKWHRIKAKD
ncbi:DUF1496 domain-containing protein [Photobacterium obscurum]|uniref:DUF1496 domain-containing protein n=1 Tax=Photobacterium obscurum TaxID=2829490 RepID=UPI00389AC766